MSNNRQVICAGCLGKYAVNETKFHRRKRWCGDEICKENINLKVKHANYKKQQNKIKNGTFRHGVSTELREIIKTRDLNVCQLCQLEKENEKLQVHHIVPVSNNGTDDHSNLILLCNICHTKVHQQGWESFEDKFKKLTNRYLSR